MVRVIQVIVAKIADILSFGIWDRLVEGSGKTAVFLAVYGLYYQSRPSFVSSFGSYMQRGSINHDPIA